MTQRKCLRNWVVCFLIPCLLIDSQLGWGIGLVQTGRAAPSTFNQAPLFSAEAVSAPLEFNSHATGHGAFSLRQTIRNLEFAIPPQAKSEMPLRLSAESHSFYGSALLAELKQDNNVYYENRRDVRFNQLDDDKFIGDRFIPGGSELRQVLSLLKQAGVNIPIERLVVFDGNQLTYKSKSTKGQQLSATRVLTKEEQKTMLEAIPVRKGESYVLYAHEEAIKSHPGFQRDAFAFWLIVLLHELAHIEGNYSHESLIELGLGWNYDVRLNARQIAMKFGELNILPFAQVALLDGRGIEAILAISGPAFRRLRERGLTNPADLNVADVAAISDIAEHTGLLPGLDYRPASTDDFLRLPKHFSNQAIQKAEEMEIDGSVVEEVFAGGAASRIRSFLNLMVSMNLLKAGEEKLLWNVPLRYFPKALAQSLRDMQEEVHGDRESAMEPVWNGISEELRGFSESLTLAELESKSDWGHWGARAMLARNAYIRRVARHLGVDEEEALRKKRILFHVSHDDLELMVHDFASHKLYGFGEIIFVINEPGPFIMADRSTGSFRILKPEEKVRMNGDEKKVGDIVYGHGPATMALIRPGAAYILTPGESLKLLTLDSSKSGTSVSRYFRRVYADRPSYVIRENRLNDLGFLNPTEEEVEELAFFNELRVSAHPSYALFRMVRNPRMMNVSIRHTEDGVGLSIDYPSQAGGLSFVFGSGDQKRVLPIESPAVAGVTAEYTRKMIKEGGKPATDYISEMRTLKSGLEWLQTVDRVGLSYFFGIHKWPGKEDPARLTIEGGIILKPQTATGHLALAPALGAQAFLASQESKSQLFPGYLTDLKTTDIYQSLRSSLFAEKLDHDPLVLALGIYYGFEACAMFVAESLREQVRKEHDALTSAAHQQDVRQAA